MNLLTCSGNLTVFAVVYDIAYLVLHANII